MNQVVKSILSVRITCIFLLAVGTTWTATAVTGDREEQLPDIIVVHHPDAPKSEQEAIVILPGFGDKRGRRMKQKKYFEQTEYDLYIPNYRDRQSVDGCVEKLHTFYEAHDLKSYKKVHVFSYILGSWVLNKYIEKYGKGNIASIVYDRSPLQERAPQVIVDRIPLIGKILKGPVLKDMSTIAYPPIPPDGIRMGILVESKATTLIKVFRKKAMSYGPIDWHHLDFNQEASDQIFIWLNHDQLYSRFDVVGQDILHFIEHGQFTSTARREPYDWDVFKRYRE